MNFSSFDAIVALIFSRIFGLPFVARLNIEKAFLEHHIRNCNCIGPNGTKSRKINGIAMSEKTQDSYKVFLF